MRYPLRVTAYALTAAFLSAAATSALLPATAMAETTKDDKSSKTKSKAATSTAAKDKDKTAKDKSRDKAKDKATAQKPAGTTTVTPPAASAVTDPVDPAPAATYGRTKTTPSGLVDESDSGNTSSLYKGGSAPAPASASASGKPITVLPPEKDAADYIIKPEVLARAVYYRGALLMSDDTAYTRKKYGADNIVWSRTFRGLEDQVFGTTTVKLGVGRSLINAALLKQLNDQIAAHESTNPGVYGPVQKFQLADGSVGYAFIVLAKESRGVCGFVTSADGSFDLASTIIFSTRYPLVEKTYNAEYLGLILPPDKDDLKKAGKDAKEINNVKLVKLMQLTLASVYPRANRDFRVFAMKKANPNAVIPTQHAANNPGEVPAGSGDGTSSVPASPNTPAAPGGAAPGTTYVVPATQYTVPVTNPSDTTPPVPQPPAPAQTRPKQPAPVTNPAPAPTPAPTLPRSETPRSVHKDL
ncbi:MAG TPA: hypothetical protein VK970_04100 [Candidatus Methylacidiphilales bacterium]|nr:hypothetical protein [Candidatus Methylacidiphilales bacterium]